MEEEIKLEVAKNVDTKDIELALQTDKKVDEAVTNYFKVYCTVDI